MGFNWRPCGKLRLHLGWYNVRRTHRRRKQAYQSTTTSAKVSSHELRPSAIVHTSRSALPPYMHSQTLTSPFVDITPGEMAKGSLLGLLGDAHVGLCSAPTSSLRRLAVGLASPSSRFPSAPSDNPLEGVPGYCTPTTALGAAFDSLKVDFYDSSSAYSTPSKSLASSSSPRPSSAHLPAPSPLLKSTAFRIENLLSEKRQESLNQSSANFYDLADGDPSKRCAVSAQTSFECNIDHLRHPSSSRQLPSPLASNALASNIQRASGTVHDSSHTPSTFTQSFAVAKAVPIKLVGESKSAHTENDEEMDSGKASDSDPSSSLSPDADPRVRSTISCSAFGTTASLSPIPSREYTPIHVTTAFSPSSTTSDLASSISTNSTAFASHCSGGQSELDSRCAIEPSDAGEATGTLIEDSNGTQTIEKILAENGIEKGMEMVETALMAQIPQASWTHIVAPVQQNSSISNALVSPLSAVRHDKTKALGKFEYGNGVKMERNTNGRPKETLLLASQLQESLYEKFTLKSAYEDAHRLVECFCTFNWHFHILYHI
ncbi:unnamed protein product [Toxocara canis]|uniref:Protein kinase domain-containing protein n=1 Tax=Toxocara canis TaxID=6265 RepID=A0A183U118_TOXCA|nr:unnamed protein product [Toxocara canis]